MAGAVVAVAEVVHWRASTASPPLRTGPGACAVVVLGYPSRRGGGLHPIQRWRTAIGVRTLEAAGGGVLIFTGGASRGCHRTEAAAMAAYAVDELGTDRDRILIEPEARSTWENLLLALPLADRCARISIASDPLHASRGRRYAAQQRPDLAVRLVGARDYRVLERWTWKVAIAAYEAAVRVRDLVRRRG